MYRKSHFSTDRYKLSVLEFHKGIIYSREFSDQTLKYPEFLPPITFSSQSS
jgi:hypothetical protein